MDRFIKFQSYLVLFIQVCCFLNYNVSDRFRTLQIYIRNGRTLAETVCFFYGIILNFKKFKGTFNIFKT